MTTSYIMNASIAATSVQLRGQMDHLCFAVCCQSIKHFYLIIFSELSFIGYNLFCYCLPRQEGLDYVNEIIKSLNMEEYADAVVNVPSLIPITAE